MFPKHYFSHYKRQKWTLPEKLFGKQVFKNHNCSPFQFSSTSLSISASFFYFLCYSYLLLTFGAVILLFHSICWQFPLFRLWLLIYSWHSFFKTVSEKRLIVPLKCARRFLILVQIKLMSITSREVRVEIIKLRCQKDLRNGKLKRNYFLTLDTTSSSGKGEKKGNKR